MTFEKLAYIMSTLKLI